MRGIKTQLIKKGVKITGPVIIGENCNIEEYADIRENTSIANNSNLPRIIPTLNIHLDISGISASASDMDGDSDFEYLWTSCLEDLEILNSDTPSPSLENLEEGFY